MMNGFSAPLLMERERLYVSDFSTTTFPPAEQFTAWRSGHATMFDFSPLDGGPPAAFFAEARTYLLGNLFVGWTTIRPPVTRDERKIAKASTSFSFV